MDLLKLVTSLACVALLAACSAETEPTAGWRRWDTIAAPLDPELGGPGETVLALPAAAAPLRVVSFNVAFGDDLDRLAADLSTDPALARAGLILLQEIESYPAEGRSRAAELAARFGMYFGYAPSREKRDGTHGLAILSAFPIEDLEVMWLPRTDVPRTGHPRIAIAADVRVGERLLRVVNLHLDTTLNVNERLVHLRPAVLDHVDPVIVLGDFNTNDFVWADDTVPLLPLDSALDTAQAPVIDDFMTRLGFSAATAGFGATAMNLGVEQRLDSIYVRGLEPGEGGVDRSVAVSDHWPIWLDVELR